MDAIVLAAATPKDIEKFGKNKSLIEYNNKKLVGIAVDAVSNAENVERVFLVGDIDEMKPFEGSVHRIINPVGNAIDNVVKCINDSEIKGKYIVLASDLPFITTEAINDFIQKCSVQNSSLYYTTVLSDVFKHKYPAYEKTFFKLKEGSFTGGNIFIADTDATLKLVEISKTYFNNRKSPLKLAGLIGFKSIFKFLLGKLSVEDIKETFKKRTGYDVSIMITHYAEIAYDIDRPEQLDSFYTKKYA